MKSNGSLILVNKHDHIIGKKNAPLIIIEYGDLLSYTCRDAYSFVKKIMGVMGKKISFVYRQFPVQSNYLSRLAAEASESAGAQGKFWEMHDLLFEYHNSLIEENLLEYADHLGLDIIKFKEDLEDHRYLPKIQKDIENGFLNGVSNIPTFFVNEKIFNKSYQTLFSELKK